MSAKTVSNEGWFRVAVQALVVLATSDGHCSSGTIALGVDAHAVFLRRLLAQLVRGHLVEAREGRDGGYRLARPADEITLDQIFRAMRAAAAPAQVRVDSPRMARVQSVLDGIGAEFEVSLLQVLAGYTLADVMARAEVADGALVALTVSPAPLNE